MRSISNGYLRKTFTQILNIFRAKIIILQSLGEKLMRYIPSFRTTVGFGPKKLRISWDNYVAQIQHRAGIPRDKSQASLNFRATFFLFFKNFIFIY